MLQIELEIIGQIMDQNDPERIVHYFEKCYQNNPKFHHYKRELILASVKWNHLQLFQYLLGRNYSIERNDDLEGPSVVHFAIFMNRETIAKILLQQKAEQINVDEKAKYDWAETEERSITELVLDLDNVVLLKCVLPLTSQKHNFLHYACAANSVECLHYILLNTDCIQCINSRNSEGKLPLFLASEKGGKLFDILLDNGAEISLLDVKDGETVLCNFCGNISMELPQVLERLLQAGINPNKARDTSGQSPVERLIRQITWPLGRADDGSSNYVSLQGDISISQYHKIIQQSLKVLLEKGANVDARYAPKVCEKLITYIQDELFNHVWRDIGQEQFRQQVMLPVVSASRMAILVDSLTQLILTLELLVQHGAIINYEHYISPNVMQNMRSTFRCHRAYCEEEVEVHMLYPSIKEFFYLLLLISGQNSLLIEMIEPAFNTLTCVLLNHGLSDKEKCHILDLVKLPSVWLTTLKALPTRLYQKYIWYALQRISDRCHFFAYKDKRFHQSLRTMVKTPRSLLDICRVVIRNQLGPVMTHKIEEIQLPQILKSYVINLDS